MDKERSNEIARKFIQQWEGCRLTAYEDAAGVLTIGYGSTGPHVRPGMTITHAEATSLLEQDMERFIRAVDGLVIVPINENQRAALISFAFNVGRTAFRTSTLLSKLNKGRYDEVPEELARWNKAGGVVLKGLVNRRAAEADLWLQPVESGAPPPIPPDVEPLPPSEPPSGGFFSALASLLRRLFG